MFKGSIPALVTPFRDGKIDEAALIGLVNWHVAEGSHGIVAVGTTGETPTLSHEEHQHCIEVIVRTAAGRIPVIAGAGSNNTDESVSLMRFAKNVGAAAALVVTPYYNKPSQRGLYHHYKTLHDAVDLPIIIYNIPGRSVIDMTPATMGELSQLPRIIGVKDATGDVGRASDQRIACGPDFLQLSGNDDTALGFNAHGGSGCISVVANIAPRLSSEFQQAMLAGDYARALGYQDRLMPLHRACFAEPNPAPTKFALSLLGKC
ncbi:MAG TPA: 4-hydroxy-tetrahydrodipicolinate synthase, partial [Amaricoccus sp.]|nr:4-hydroxy-tetrahydrodipicolinate synthase [Amaricoccus sp.]